MNLGPLTPLELVTGLRVSCRSKNNKLCLQTQKEIRRFSAPVFRSFVTKRSCQMKETAIRLGVTKACSGCTKTKPITDFSYKWVEERYEAKCKVCVTERQKRLYRRRASAAKNTKFVRSSVGTTISNDFDSALVGKPNRTAIDKFSRIFSSSLRDLIEDGSI